MNWHFRRKSHSESGYTIILAVLLLLISSLATAAIGRITLFRTDALFALQAGRRTVEKWDNERSVILRNSIPTKSFKYFGNSGLATIKLTNNWDKNDLAKLPLFYVASAQHPLVNWRKFLSEVGDPCLIKVEQNAPVLEGEISFFEHTTCTSTKLSDQRNLIFGNLSLNSLEAGGRALTVTGEIRIDKIKVTGSEVFELVGGSSVNVNTIELDPSASLLIHSITGQIVVPDKTATPLFSSCKLQLEEPFTEIRGCLSSKKSLIWSEIRYLGEYQQSSFEKN